MVRNNDLLKGVAIGIGAAVLVPVVVTALVPIVKPIARSAVKTGMALFEKGRESVEEMGEALLGNARAVISNFYQYVFPTVVRTFLPVSGMNENIAAIRHGFDRILQQVGKHLHQIAPVSRK